MKYLFTLLLVLTISSASLYAQEPVNNSETPAKTNESNGPVVSTPQTTDKVEPQKKEEAEKPNPVDNEVKTVVPKPEEVKPNPVEAQKNVEQVKQEEALKEAEEVKKQEEPIPEGKMNPAQLRGPKVIKKDLSRRVVIRRVSVGEKSQVQRPRVLKEGYRIQIFTGGNKREDKAAAQRSGEKSRRIFPQFSVYSHFISPRWTCRVGDFESFEEAKKYLDIIKKSRAFSEARIVRCNVLVAK